MRSLAPQILLMVAVAAVNSGCTINVIRNRYEGWTFVRITSFFDQSAKSARISARNTTNAFEVHLNGYNATAGDNIRAAGSAAGAIIGEAAKKAVVP